MRRADCALALCLLLGCDQVDVVAVRTPDAAQHDAGMHREDGGMQGRAGNDATVPDAKVPVDSGHDAGDEDAGMPEPPCPYRTRPAGTTTQDRVFARVLTHAVCSCEAIALGTRLETDAFDGALGPYTRGEIGGDVAANREISFDTTSVVRGSLVAAGSSGLSLGPNVMLEVQRDLALAGPFEGSLAGANIARDARVAGRIVLESLSVGGELVQPAGTERSVTGTSDIHAMRAAPVDVAEPCACDDAVTIDSGALVRAAMSNAMTVSGAAPVLAQHCGEFWLADATTNTLHVTAHDSAALYVGGDLQVRGDLIVDTDPGVELDLFIESNATVDGVIALGSQPNQGAVRVFVGGAGTVQLSMGGALHGVLYAPQAELVQSAALEVTGALFVRRVASTADLTLHYDRDLARVHP
jgi:cytoskeletal protein CcmA (bactofilin family)